MAGRGYCLVLLISASIIGATIGSPLNYVFNGETDILDTELSTSTTEHPHAAIARAFEKPMDKPGSIAYAGGKHKFSIAPGEDETKRILEEYYYHFERVEKNLPHTTRKNDFRPPPKNG